jgi:hypothetical protein
MKTLVKCGLIALVAIVGGESDAMRNRRGEQPRNTHKTPGKPIARQP